MNKRTVIGSALSLLWIGLIYFVISRKGGWHEIDMLAPNAIGDFFAGIFAPLAFLWLVIGYLQQGEELRLQREQLELQRQELKFQRQETHRLADEAAKQAKAIESTELHARRDTFLRVAELTTNELHGIAVRFVIFLVGAGLTEDVLRRYDRGEKDAFYDVLCDQFADQSKRNPSVAKLKQRREWPSTAERFCSKFERLIKQAESCDPDGHLVEHFTTSSLGRACKLIRETLNEYPQ